MVIMSAFQAEYEGSIPLFRSTFVNSSCLWVTSNVLLCSDFFHKSHKIILYWQNASLVQLVEQCLRKASVVGSNPTGSSILLIWQYGGIGRHEGLKIKIEYPETKVRK